MGKIEKSLISNRQIQRNEKLKEKCHISDFAVDNFIFTMDFMMGCTLK